MTAAWTIRSRRANDFPHPPRPASLTSLPDLSDDLDLEGRPSSILSGTHGSQLAWGFADNDFPDGTSIYRTQSNTSVAFLGRRITREYRSSFVLNDDQMVGVTRRETFHPEQAMADVRVS